MQEEHALQVPAFRMLQKDHRCNLQLLLEHCAAAMLEAIPGLRG